MNKVMLIGRLTAQPELKYTASNIPNTRFSIAVNRTFSNSEGEKETDFFNIVVWRKQAENVCNFLNKGSLVAIDGRLQQNNYTDKDGNNRTIIDVIAENVQFLESKKNDQTTNEENSSIDPFDEFSEQVTIDDNFLD